MTPLLLFLLAATAVYVGTVTAAFSKLMRLSLRLAAERSGRDDLLGLYLDDPLRLFIPARLLLATIPVVAAVLLARVVGTEFASGLPLNVLAVVGFLVLCEHLIPLLIVRRDPERVLDWLLPSFHALTSLLVPLTAGLLRAAAASKPDGAENGHEHETPSQPDETARRADAAAAPEQQEERQARELLRSLVDFRETMVREVMTPRPDIVAVSESLTQGELFALFREQQYSRMPVYSQSLDNIVGFIVVKDLIQLTSTDPTAPITSLIRPALFVPETKRVPELLREFQRHRAQSAIVVDEYGGLAGLVTVEDLLEEIVGEIRDEYDVETEVIVAEEDGTFVVSGNAHIEELADRLKVDIEGEGFETVGGYLLAHLGRVPTVAERFDVDGLTVEVLEAERRRINRVRISRREVAADGALEPSR